MEKLTGKVAVVTGGATAINATIAAKFLEEGAKAALILDDSIDRAKAAVEGSGIGVLPCDIGSFADVTRCFDEIKANFGEVPAACSAPCAAPSSLPWRRFCPLPAAWQCWKML